MRRYLCGIAIGMGLLLLTGCSEKEGAAPGGKKENCELTIWAWEDTFNVRAAQMAAEIYEGDNPGVQVQVVSKEQNEILSELTNGLAAGLYEELPDIVLIEDYHIQDMLFQYEDAFEDLTDYFDFDFYMDYKVEVSSREGRHYGIPFDSGTAVTFYREDIIRQAGYSEADMKDLTWEKFIQIGKAVKEKTGCFMLTLDPNDLGLIRIMLQSAGNWYVENDGTTVNLTNNQALKEALSIYEELLETGIGKSITGWEDFVATFQEGEVASVVSGCWAISNIKGAQEQAGTWRAACVPRMEKIDYSVNASNIGGSSWYILKNKPHVKQAVAFMDQTFAHNTDFINRVVREINVVTTYKESVNLPANQEPDEFFGGQQIQAFFAETAGKIPSVNYGMRTYEIEAILTDELQRILKGKDVDEGLETVQMKAQAIVGR